METMLDSSESEQKLNILAQESFCAEEFPVRFAEIYNAPKPTLEKIRNQIAEDGQSNEIIWKKRFCFRVAKRRKSQQTLDDLITFKFSKTETPRFLIASDGISVSALDVETNEVRHFLYRTFNEQFEFFMPLMAGSSRKQKITIKNLEWFHETEHGQIFHGDSFHLISNLRSNSVDLIVTSPPFGLISEKDYGNVQADEYIDWFKPFAKHLHRILKESGSLVIDIGGTWIKGLPTRHLYHFKLLIMLCEEFGFHLAQDFYWWNPSKLPTPAEWVTIRRIRVKDAINKVWWLSKSPWPKASNRRVLQPYSASMNDLLENGYKPNLRPSGHNISSQFGTNNGAAIPPNLIAAANTESNSAYLRYCSEHSINPHPARFPSELPEYFIRMLTDEQDVVLDPFAGSCVTGEVSERLKRKWICSELRKDYVAGALGRFNIKDDVRNQSQNRKSGGHYQIARPGLNWQDNTSEKLAKDGGRNARLSMQSASQKSKKSSKDK